MEYKPLGDTDVLIPEIGLGTWAYTGGDTPLRHGVELGATLIDTAESYGTEEAVGSAIGPIRDKVFLATKVSPQNFRRKDVLAAADGSLRRLGIDHIDLYQLHWPNDAVPIEETMGAMEELWEAGKVRYIGVSNFSVAQLKGAQAALSRTRVVSNQVKYSLADRHIEDDLLSYCQETRVTIIAYSPLEQGMDRLAGGRRREALRGVAAQAGKTEAQVALNWCINKQSVVAIPKANSVGHVEDDCGASGWYLTPEQMAALEGAFA